MEVEEIWCRAGLVFQQLELRNNECEGLKIDLENWRE